MEAVIRVNMDNAAFGESWGYELSRILKKIAKDLPEETEADFESHLMDINGNVVGTFTVTP